jgi:hypothetical protein
MVRSLVWPLRALSGALVLTTGCVELPTDTPIIDQRWVVPSDSTTLSVDRVLPSSVTVVGNSFQVAVPTVNTSQQLAQFCSQCTVGMGAIPKPAFTANIAASAALPSDVAAATLTSGTVVVGITSSLPFDIIRPSATARGVVTIAISNNGALIGTDTIAGSSSSIPPNTRVDRTITLRAGSVLSGPLEVQVRVVSPEGDPVQFAAAQNISVQGVPSNIRVSRATVLLNNRTVSSAATTVDLSDVDDGIRDRTEGGALLVSIANPFALRGNLTLTLSAPGITPVVKALRLEAASPGTTPQRLEFTRDEIRSLFGRDNLSLTVSGPVSGTGTGGAVDVLPGMQAVMSTRFEVAVRLGGN